MNTIAIIRQRMLSKDTLICAGIDPNIQRMPPEIVSLKMSDEEKIMKFLNEYIRIVAPHVCAFKVQKAYFDSFEAGHALLADVIRLAHEQGVPVIIDGKIGDIDETMKEYIRNLFDGLNADGIVVNPYMGDDVMEPFALMPDKAIITLAKTSNTGGAVVQDMQTASGRMLWEEVLDLIVHRWNTADNMIPVIAATQTIDGHSVRKIVGDHGLIFLAGSGAQGGSLNMLKTLVNTDRRGVMVNSSRALMYPIRKNGEDWQTAIHRSVIDFQAQLNFASS